MRSGGRYFFVTRSSFSTFFENQNTSHATMRKSAPAPSTGPRRKCTEPTSSVAVRHCPAGDEERHDRHEDAVHQCRHQRVRLTADDHGDCQADHAVLLQERHELAAHAWLLLVGLRLAFRLGKKTRV